MVDTTRTIGRDSPVSDLSEAGAPDDEMIEAGMTPAMVSAGLQYLEDRGLNMLTTQTADPDFVTGFYKAVVLASKA